MNTQNSTPETISIEAALVEAMHTGDWAYYFKLISQMP
jgi:hypothetical protein